MEVCIAGPYSHNGLQEPDEAVVDIVAACREALGPDFTMMVDVAYAWSNATQALAVLKQLEPFNLFFLETPIDIDDLEGYASCTSAARFVLPPESFKTLTLNSSIWQIEGGSTCCNPMSVASAASPKRARFVKLRPTEAGWSCPIVGRAASASPRVGTWACRRRFAHSLNSCPRNSATHRSAPNF